MQGIPYKKMTRQSDTKSEKIKKKDFQPTKVQNNKVQNNKIQQQTIISSEDVNDDPFQLRKYKYRVSQAIKGVNVQQQSQIIQQLRRQIKKKFFSNSAIQKQMISVSQRLFYYPSQNFAKFIQKNTGTQAQAVIYKCVAFRHGDLLLLQQKTKDQILKYQISYVMQNLFSWGKYFIDIPKVKTISLETGDINNKNYHVTQLQIQIIISNQIQVKFKNKSITPTQFKNDVLKQIVMQRLTRKATSTFHQSLKKFNIQRI